MRFLVLYKYGGIYTDADVLLLRSLEPFAHYDFVYEWSFVKEGMNTTVFGARKESPFAEAVIKAALAAAFKVDTTTGSATFDAGSFSGTFHPLNVLSRVPAEIAANIEALPSIPFDPLWLTVDAKGGGQHNINHIHRLRAWGDFLSEPPSYMTAPAVPTDVFKGAFAHHWHNTWSASLVNASLMGQAVEVYDQFLVGKC
jgi:hypothetical protein